MVTLEVTSTEQLKQVTGPLLISATYQHPRMSYELQTRPHNFNWHRAMVEGKVLSNTIENVIPHASVTES